ncbi:30S ribosomal protein S17 [Candidatus Peribacteria bacterium]|nr:30S ribosomal protein S17 [Candidatus Peribacteria bacterium]
MQVKQGVIVKKSGDKSVRVRVTERQAHPKYKKIYTVVKHFVAHDEANECGVNDAVTIQSCRPISKQKSWKVVDRTPAIVTE